jgi:ABC-type xylose transport system permease subunit
VAVAGQRRGAHEEHGLGGDPGGEAVVDGVVAATHYALASLGFYRRRVTSGLAGREIAPVITRIVIVAAVVIVAVAVENSDRGVPLAVLILLAFVAGMELLVTRTPFGRHVYAVGGNAEAARRAGISVHRVRIACFAISGTMARSAASWPPRACSPSTRARAAATCSCSPSPDR